MAGIFSMANLGLGESTNNRSETSRQSTDFLSVADFSKKYGKLERKMFGRPDSGAGVRAKRRAHVPYKGILIQVFVEDGVDLGKLDSMYVEVQQSSNRGMTANLINFAVDEEDAAE